MGGRIPGEATGGGGAASASILGGSMGAGMDGAAAGAGIGARKRGACGTGAGGAELRTSKSRVILPRLGSRCVQILRDVERDGFAEVDYEIWDAAGERGVDGGDHH